MAVDGANVLRGESLAAAAECAYAQAIADFYHPPLPHPVIEHEVDSSSYFYIDSATWTIHLNTAGVPLHLAQKEAESYLLSICHHELQHYLVCPYDGVTNGMMFAAARRHVNDATALFVCNLFADIIVDSGLLKRFPKLTHNRISTSIHEAAIRWSEHSALWKLIVATYRAMWRFTIPSTAEISDNTYSAAEAIASIMRKSANNEARWFRAVEKIAKIIADWLPDNGSQILGASVSSSEEERGEGAESVVYVPSDVDAVMGSPIEVRNGDLARRCMEGAEGPNLEEEMERLAIEVDQRGGNLGDLEGVYLVAGIGSKKKDWIRFWYRAVVRGMIRFELYVSPKSGRTPLASELWRLGDPIEELDIVQSLQAFPVLIPNLSTRKWLTTSSITEGTSKTPPDLLLVIDSSGSMTWSMSRTRVSGPYHTALVSAFAAMNFALREGCQVAAINFSDDLRLCSWTRSKSTIESVLLQYQGHGTVAPIKGITTLCSEAGAPVMVLMITDAEIANWRKLLSSIRNLTRQGQKFFMFLIGADDDDLDEEYLQELVKAGSTIVPVRSVSDLPGLVIREVRRTYGRN